MNDLPSHSVARIGTAGNSVRHHCWPGTGHVDFSTAHHLPQNQREAKKAELEKTVSEALHRSIANGLKAAVTKFKADSVSTVIINAAADYVVANNPDAIKRFDISGKTLNEMIMSKVPDVLAGMQK